MISVNDVVPVNATNSLTASRGGRVTQLCDMLRSQVLAYIATAPLKIRGLLSFVLTTPMLKTRLRSTSKLARPLSTCWTPSASPVLSGLVAQPAPCPSAPRGLAATPQPKGSPMMRTRSTRPGTPFNATNIPTAARGVESNPMTKSQYHALVELAIKHGASLTTDVDQLPGESVHSPTQARLRYKGGYAMVSQRGRVTEYPTRLITDYPDGAGCEGMAARVQLHVHAPYGGGGSSVTGRGPHARAQRSGKN